MRTKLASSTGICADRGNEAVARSGRAPRIHRRPVVPVPHRGTAGVRAIDGVRGPAGMLGLATVCVLGLAACGSASGGSGPAGNGASAAGSSINVVASTDVYGDIVRQVAGDAAQVTSVIHGSGQDPHSYQADTRTQLALSKADLVVENGGGYDDFVDSMLRTAGGSPTVVNAVKVSGRTAPAGGELNEHVWYDFPAMQKVADLVAVDLGRVDPSRAGQFTTRARAFDAKLDTLIAAEATAKQKYAGAGAAITEPVPGYLLDAMGLTVKTPTAFSEAIEEGTDVPVPVMDSTLKLFSGHAVKVLAYNQQTSGPETEQVLAAAKSAGVPVVGVTETLPSGKDYVTWMTANVAAVAAALAS